MLQNSEWKIEENDDKIAVFEHGKDEPVLITTVAKFTALKGLIEHFERQAQS